MKHDCDSRNVTRTRWKHPLRKRPLKTPPPHPRRISSMQTKSTAFKRNVLPGVASSTRSIFAQNCKRSGWKHWPAVSSSCELYTIPLSLNERSNGRENKKEKEKEKEEEKEEEEERVERNRVIHRTICNLRKQSRFSTGTLIARVRRSAEGSSLIALQTKEEEFNDRSSLVRHRLPSSPSKWRTLENGKIVLSIIANYRKEFIIPIYFQLTLIQIEIWKYHEKLKRGCNVCSFRDREKKRRLKVKRMYLIIKKTSIPMISFQLSIDTSRLDCLKSGRLRIIWNDEGRSSRMKEIGWFPGWCTEVGEIEAQFRRHGRTNGLDLIPTLMLRQATIHFAPTNRLDPVPVHSLSVYLSISISVKDRGTRWSLPRHV